MGTQTDCCLFQFLMGIRYSLTNEPPVFQARSRWVGGGGNILSGVARGGGGQGGGPGPRAPALEGAPAQLQRRSQVSLAGGGG